jgi:hypothetical protein
MLPWHGSATAPSNAAASLALGVQGRNGSRLFFATATQMFGMSATIESFANLGIWSVFLPPIPRRTDRRCLRQRCR